MYVVRWGRDGAQLKAADLSGTVLRNTGYFFQSVLCYTRMGNGALGVRRLDGSAFDGTGLSIVPGQHLSRDVLMALLNSRVPSYVCRLFSQSFEFRGGYVERIPMPYTTPSSLELLGAWACHWKGHLTRTDPTEVGFEPERVPYESLASRFGGSLWAMAQLHSVEAEVERLCIEGYGLGREAVDLVLQETGTPAGFFPLVRGYDSFPYDFTPSDDYLARASERWARTEESEPRLRQLKERLKHLLLSRDTGDGDVDAPDVDIVGGEEEPDEAGSPSTGSHSPIPPESLVEELSQELQIHPISIYWLLKEGFEKDGWRCPSEERRITADRITVTILHLLGHRWPRQVEAGEPVPDWAVGNGIIPLTDGTGEPNLYGRVRERIQSDFSGGGVAAIEREFEEIMGKPLQTWLATEFFKHHVKQFKKRPIAWQLQSSAGTAAGKGKKAAKREPAFSCLVYYHKLDDVTLTTIQTQ